MNHLFRKYNLTLIALLLGLIVLLGSNGGTAAIHQAAHIVQPIVELICEQGVSPQSITILRTAEDARSACEAPTDRLSPECRSGVRVVVHHPDVRSELSYLANTTPRSLRIPSPPAAWPPQPSGAKCRRLLHRC